MTSHEHDPAHEDGQPQEPLDLGALRDAFHGLPTPDATPPLDESDAQTQATVAWMVEALAALPVPDVQVPKLSDKAPPRPLLKRLPGSRPKTASSPAPWMRHAAAAAVFAALALALNWASSTARVDEPAFSTAIPGFREASQGSSGLVAVTADHLEVRSGPVRLVLLTQASSPADGPALNLP